jgi:hypothetical protein
MASSSAPTVSWRVRCNSGPGTWPPKTERAPEADPWTFGGAPQPARWRRSPLRPTSGPSSQAIEQSTKPLLVSTVRGGQGEGPKQAGPDQVADRRAALVGLGTGFCRMIVAGYGSSSCWATTFLITPTTRHPKRSRPADEPLAVWSAPHAGSCWRLVRGCSRWRRATHEQRPSRVSLPYGRFARLLRDLLFTRSTGSLG